MRLALCALCLCLLAGCVLVPLPVPIAMPAATPAAAAYVEITSDRAAFYENWRWNGLVGGAQAGDTFPITGVDSFGEWWQIEFHDRLVWVHADDVTAHNADAVPVLWP